MPARKGNTPDRIKAAARKVFLQYGFRDASVQMIAAEVGISAPGIYKHFDSKEVLFAALVEPVIAGIRGILRRTERQKDALFQRGQADAVWDKEQTFAETLDFIYEHFEDMKLLICRAEGTRYENIVDRIAEEETTIILRTLPTLRAQGLAIPSMAERTVALMVKNQYRTYVEFIRSDFTREEADAYIQAVGAFFTAGWRALLGF